MADSRIVVAAVSEDWDTWLSKAQAGQHVTQSEHNTAVVQFAAALDTVLDYANVLARAGGADDTTGPMVPRFQTISADSSLGLTSPTPIIGMAATETNLQTMKNRTGDAMFTEQRLYAGALAWQVYQLRKTTVQRATGRTTGVLWLGIPAGYYIITGIAAAACVAGAAVVSWIQESQETQRSAVIVAAAGEDYGRRLATYRATGSMPSASEREIAARGTLESGANSFWAQLGRGLGSGVQTGSKWVMGAAALGLLLMMSGSSKGASNG